MGAPAYKRLELSLVNARTREIVYPGGAQIDGVTVLQLPAGANVEVAFGTAADLLPLLTQGQEFELCPPSTEGLIVSHPAGAGTLILALSFGGLSVTGA